MIEAEVEKPVVKRAKARGALVVKQTHAGARSHPDRAFYLPGGRLLQVEFKAPGKLPTPLQAQTISELRRLGFDVQVIDSKENGFALIDARMATPPIPTPQHDAFTCECLRRALAGSGVGQDKHHAGGIQGAAEKGAVKKNAGRRPFAPMLPRVAKGSC